MSLPVREGKNSMAMEHELLEALASAPLSGRQLRVALAVARLTLGHREFERVLTSRKISEVCRISEGNVRASLQELVEWGVVRRGPAPEKRAATIGLELATEVWCVPARDRRRPKNGASTRTPHRRDVERPRSGTFERPDGGASLLRQKKRRTPPQEGEGKEPRERGVQEEPEIPRAQLKEKALKYFEWAYDARFGRPYVADSGDAERLVEVIDSCGSRAAFKGALERFFHDPELNQDPLIRDRAFNVWVFRCKVNRALSAWQAQEKRIARERANEAAGGGRVIPMSPRGEDAL